MKYYNLANTDLKVSALSLGCMRIATKSVEEVEKLVLTALDQGINFFDHADIYGSGKSEELFGEVLKRNPEIRAKMILQTKCGIVSGKRYDFSKEHILKSVDESLKRLQTDHVEILLLHRPDALCDPKKVSEAFDELYASGKVKYFGVSNHTPYQIELLKKYSKHPILINQLQLSIVHSGMIDSGINANMKYKWAQDKDGSILDYCRLNDITIQPWSVLQASWEEGTFLEHPDYPKLNATLENLAKGYNVTKSCIAIAWLLRHPSAMQPILGTTSPEHLIEICQAVNINLTAQQWYDLYRAEEKPLP